MGALKDSDNSINIKKNNFLKSKELGDAFLKKSNKKTHYYLKGNNNSAINIINEKKSFLLNQIEINKSFIELFDGLILNYEQQPFNDYNNNNIMNVVNDINLKIFKYMNYKIIKNEELCFFGKNYYEALLSKIQKLEKKLLNILNINLNANLI